jgi:hypothetical protein
MKRSLTTRLAGPVMAGLIMSNLAEIVRTQGHVLADSPRDER